MLLTYCFRKFWLKVLVLEHESGNGPSFLKNVMIDRSKGAIKKLEARYHKLNGVGNGWLDIWMCLKVTQSSNTTSH